MVAIAWFTTSCKMLPIPRPMMLMTRTAKPVVPWTRNAGIRNVSSHATSSSNNTASIQKLHQQQHPWRSLARVSSNRWKQASARLSTESMNRVEKMHEETLNRVEQMKKETMNHVDMMQDFTRKRVSNVVDYGLGLFVLGWYAVHSVHEQRTDILDNKIDRVVARLEHEIGHKMDYSIDRKMEITDRKIKEIDRKMEVIDRKIKEIDRKIKEIDGKMEVIDRKCAKAQG